MMAAWTCLLTPCAMAAEDTAGQVDGPRFGVLGGFGLDTNDPAAIPSVARQFPAVAPKDPAASIQPLTGNEKFRLTLKKAYGPWSLAYSAAATGISQARDVVPEWEQGMEGYGKRLAHRIGRRSIKYGIHDGLGLLFHEDPRYFASSRSGIWQRSLYATGQVFVSRKDSGGFRPAYTRFVAIAGASYISRQWRPEADQTASQYLCSSALWLGFDAAKNVFAEFWPDIKRRFRR